MAAGGRGGDWAATEADSRPAPRMPKPKTCKCLIIYSPDPVRPVMRAMKRWNGDQSVNEGVLAFLLLPLWVGRGQEAMHAHRRECQSSPSGHLATPSPNPSPQRE